MNRKSVEKHSLTRICGAQPLVGTPPVSRVVSLTGRRAVTPEPPLGTVLCGPDARESDSRDHCETKTLLAEVCFVLFLKREGLLSHMLAGKGPGPGDSV